MKLRTDFLKEMGIENPKDSDFKKIEAIPDSQLLKTILTNSKTSLVILSARYGVNKRTLETIKARTK